MEEIDLKELIDMFLRKKFLIIFVIVVFGAFGVIYTTKFIVPKYESTTSLILVQTGAERTNDEINAITTADITLNSKLVDNYKAICTSKSVITSVISNLHLNYTYNELINNMSVTTKSDAEVIIVTVKDEDNERACEIANEIATVFTEKAKEIYNVQNIHILDRAEVSNKPYNINLVKNVIIFAFIGAILVFAYILLVNMLDTTVKTDVDIEKLTGIPVIASIVLNDDSTQKKSKKSKNKNKIKINQNSNNNQNDTISMFSYLNNNYDEPHNKE